MAGKVAQSPKIVSLFSGAGGLDYGFKNLGFPLSIAIDNSSWAIATHQRNFPETKAITADLVKLKASGVLEQLADILTPGEPIGIIGGPPCQGFSRANTSAVAGDPRNKLPALYLDLVTALQAKYDVRFVLFENVLGIRDSKHQVAFQNLLRRFRSAGLHEHVAEYCAVDFGVPQNRRRLIISAFASSEEKAAFLVEGCPTRLTVRDVIAGLPEPTYFRRDLDPENITPHPNHWTMRPISEKFRVPPQNIVNNRSFRRIAWDKPSPTVAYGHREIHVHPEGHRRLSIYEAMLLQGFPPEFVLEGPLSAQVEQVSNAVPPPLATALAAATAIALNAQTDVDKGKYGAVA